MDSDSYPCEYVDGICLVCDPQEQITNQDDSDEEYGDD